MAQFIAVVVVVDEVVVIAVVAKAVMQFGPVKPAAQKQIGMVPAIAQAPPK
jgi:hypothetical protein